jgi:cyclopropane fatty-acyl-phospholipid synthase-like methyltransferase
MTETPKALLDSVAEYYSGRLREHGTTPRGADWNSEEGQRLRFRELLRLVPPGGGFSIADIGCGYGSLVDALAPLAGVQYVGTDVSAEMVAAAQTRCAAMRWATFEQGVAPSQPADYAVASGILNVRLHHAADAWEAYVHQTLDVLFEAGRLGFAFNALTAYADPERQRADLHYADPLALFDRCKRRYHPHVTLLHDYGLWEFTILVRSRPT